MYYVVQIILIFLQLAEEMSFRGGFSAFSVISMWAIVSFPDELDLPKEMFQ